jgi:hypothetical protein
MLSDSSSRPQVPGLVLTGGGARAAYQAGVLKGLSVLLPQRSNPFRVIVGTSAGAVSAAVIATHAHRWHAAVAEIERCGADPRYSQIMLPPKSLEPLGRRKYWPIYEAAQAYDLPIALHVGGVNGYSSRAAHAGFIERECKGNCSQSIALGIELANLQALHTRGLTRQIQLSTSARRPCGAV